MENHSNELNPLNSNIKDKLIKYYALVILPSSSEEESDQIAEILEEADSNPTLSFWISELNLIIAERSGLMTKDFDEQILNDAAYLREYLGTKMPPNRSIEED